MTNYDSTNQYDYEHLQYDGLVKFLVLIGVSISISIGISKFIGRAIRVITTITGTLQNAIKIIVKQLKVIITTSVFRIISIVKFIGNSINITPSLNKSLSILLKSITSISALTPVVFKAILIVIKQSLMLTGRAYKTFLKTFKTTILIGVGRSLSRTKEILISLSFSAIFAFKTNLENIKPRIISFINNLKPKNTINNLKPKNTIKKDKPNIYK